MHITVYLPGSDDERDVEADELADDSMPEMSVCTATLILAIIVASFALTPRPLPLSHSLSRLLLGHPWRLHRDPLKVTWPAVCTPGGAT